MTIQNDDEDSLRVFGGSEEDLDHDDVLSLSEIERQAEEEQLREHHPEAYNAKQERTKIL